MTKPFHYNGYNEVPKDVTDVVIASNLTTIWPFAFKNCYSLSRITIPSSITTIGSRAFWNCTSLPTVTLPPSITDIEGGAFDSCISLSTIVLPPSITDIDAFHGCESLTAILIPPTVTWIGSFYGCTSLSTITLPASVTTIGDSAFYKCISLSAITLPPSLAIIGDYAFCMCTSLSTVILPPSITTIEDGTFYECTSLTTITIPPTVITIRKSAFFKCTALSTIKLPQNLIYIWYDTFYGCSNLTSIEVHPSQSFVVITNQVYDRIEDDEEDNEDYSFINEKLGTLDDVFRKRSFSPTSQKVCRRLGMSTEDATTIELNMYDKVFVNWKIYSKKKNHESRLPLFTASEQNIKWSDGLFNILEGYGAAIEEADTVTGLEAFMLAGIGRNSDMEAVYMLLQDHPAAINPYVGITK